MKSILTGVVAAVLAVGAGGSVWAQGGAAGGAAGGAPAGEQPRRPQMGGMFQDVTFESMDANKDGKVTQDEYVAAMQAAMADGLKRRFEAMDTDKNGSLSKDELQKARESMMMRGPRGSRPEGGERGSRPNPPPKPEAAPAAAPAPVK